MNLAKKVEISALCFVLFCHSVLSESSKDKCPEFNPQNELDVELITGLWFATEIVTHFEGRGELNPPPFDSCVIIQIEEIREWLDYNYDYDEKSPFRNNHFEYSDPRKLRFVKMGWNEQDKSATYTFKYNTTRRGLWIGAEPPKGSLYRRQYDHNHYIGTVQVMKAVASHLVLTFCEKSEIFTIVLTRVKNTFSIDDVESVHNLLERRGLAIKAIRELCRYNSANRVAFHTSIVFSLMTLVIMRY